jgi:glucosamine 6-phosphate synthetase-like amidotransferase/phosphosugar isomerase protein
MCGIFGYIGQLQRPYWLFAHRLLRELAIAHECRGTDASGYAALTAEGHLLCQRAPGPARKLFCSRRFGLLATHPALALIGHTRLATTGDPHCNANNHPHRAGDWALVHNGFLPGHREKAAERKLRLHTECDSELLVQVLHRYGEAAGPDTCLSLGGKQSELAIHARTRRLLAWTNGEMPLVAFRVKAWPALWWASTEVIAREALEAVGLRARFAVAKPDHVYCMEVRDGQVVMETVRADVRRERR